MAASDEKGVLTVSSRELYSRSREDAAGPWAHHLLDALATEGFYGDVTFQFRDGKPYIARKEETIKPGEDS